MCLVGYFVTSDSPPAYLILSIGFTVAGELLLTEASHRSAGSDSAVNTAITGYFVLGIAALSAIGLVVSLGRHFLGR